MAEGMAIIEPGGASDDVRIEEYERGPVDVTLLFVTACLVCVGLLAVYNGSALKAYFLGGGDDLIYLRKQASGAAMGAVGLIVASRLDYRFYQRHVYVIGGLVLGLLLLTAIPGVGVTVNGATRWIRFAGVTFQPAEAVKVFTPIFLAYSIAKKGPAVSKVFESFVSHAVLFMPFIALLMMQPDLGSSIVICLLLGIMLYVGGARVAYMFGFGGVAVIGVIWAISAEAYRLERIRAWLDPWADPEGVGYHLVNSYVALGRGGMTGTGFGEGGGRLGYIPELYNDFVAASVGEEFGFIGLCVLALLYMGFVWRGTLIARRAADTFGAYLAFGLTMLVGAQAAINLCVVTGVLPTKGLTLPFVSFGRSSLILLMFAVGVLINIGQANPDIHAMRKQERSRRREREEARQKQERTHARRRRRKLKELGADA